MSKQTITGHFLETVEKYPENVLFHYISGGWEGISYRDFSDSVRAVAFHLLQIGLQKGDRAAIVSESRHEWCAAYLSIIMAGGIAVPVDAQLGPQEIKNLMTDSEAKMVFCSQQTFANVTKAMEGLSKTDSKKAVLINLDSELYKRITSKEIICSFPEISPDDTASIIYTSGTTGNPKGVMLTHSNFCSDAEAAIEAGIVSHEDNVLSILPLHHTYAFMCTFLVPMFIGASITYPASLKGPDLMSAIKERGVSVLIGVPQVLTLIRNGIINKLKGLPQPASLFFLKLLRLSGLIRKATGINPGRVLFRKAHKALGHRFRFFASGGARLDPAVMKDLEALGFTVLEGYGLTETSPIVTFNPPEKRKPGSAGKPFPSAEIKIINPSEDGQGEIAIRGPMVMKGYYKNPAATASVIQNGWFHSGDIGHIDSEGYLFITGRTKEVIVLSSGKNIYPEDVEQLYLASPLIKEICVFGLEENGTVESLHAVIVPDFEYAKDKGISNIREAVKWEINDLSARIASYMRIKGFTVSTVPLPRTPLGKLRRFMVRELADSGAGTEQKGEPAEEGIFADDSGRKVLEALRLFCKAEKQIRPDDNLELDIGLDSLSKIELVVVLEQLFYTHLPENFMAGIHTVKELIQKMKALKTSADPAVNSGRTGWKDILHREPSPADIRGLSTGHSILTTISARIVFLILKVLMKIFFGLKAKGVENLPTGTNYILAPNHTSYLDGFAVILSLPFHYFKNIYTLGLSKFFTGIFSRWFARAANVIPIDTSLYLNKALQMSAYILRINHSLLVFPEGGRSHDGSLMEFKKGVGILAVEMGVPVVPVKIKGAFEALPRGAKWPKLNRIGITFGKPVSALDPDFSKKPQNIDKYQDFADMLRERVKDLG